MERIVLKLGMFETLMVAVIAIYVGEFLRNKIPVLKKYCLPASVVGGTLFALLSLLLYSVNIFELNFDYKTVNQLFYCLFFAASGAAASLALLKKGGKLVIIFTILAALLAALQNALDKSLVNANANNINISKLVDQINESNQYIRHLVEVKSKSDSLNMVLTNNLTRSLSREEMKEVDIKVLKGVVYISLADNMLYKSGSYEINDRAEETLRKIAKIIMDYKDYDVLIEGNTDNVPVNTKSAAMKNIRNNWDLSALRASSVVQYLQDRFGVAPKRLTAGGRGEYNPVASNDTELGKQRNRRTQIIITPKLDQFMDLIDKAPEEKK